MTALAHSFLSHLPDAVRSLEAEGVEAALVEADNAARERWTPIAVTATTFAAYLAERVPADATSLLDAIGSMQTSSLYLACACASSDESAIARVEAEFFHVIGPALRRLDKTGTLTDDATQRLRERLFVSTPSRAAKIAAYAGRGDLGKWIRAAAVRLGLDLLRTSQREQRRQEDDKVLDALADGAADPELAHLRDHYGASLRAAFAEAIASLSDKEQTVLRYHHVDGLNIERIGRLYEVHKTTAFRWLEKARSTLIAGTRDRMQAALGLETSELDSVMRLIQSDLDLSIQRLLEKEP